MLIDRRVPSLPSGVERTRVPGGGAAVLAIAAGDRITVIDVEGRQPCEVLAADASGRVDPGLIGGKVCGIADGLRAILASGSDSARSVLSGLRRRNIDLGEAKAVRLFGGDNAAGAQQEFTAQGAGVLIVAAPGDAMTPEAQDTATEIEVRIARASPRSEEFALLPDPLADARLDFEVPRSSARAYEVKEGDYIQIVDLFGRQCSDFHCFNARALQKGIERDLDNTVTRTLLGRGYPGPGLFAKVFDHEILRGHGLSGPRQLLGQFQRRAGALWHQAPARLGGAQPVLQHRHRPQ
jgi:aminomethyltransferase